jgi:competence protein ComEC
MEILAFFAGITCCYALSWPLSAAIAVACCVRPRIVLLLSVLLGFAWGWLHQYQIEHGNYTTRDSLLTRAEVTGHLVSRAVPYGRGLQFDFLAQTMNGQATHTLLRLSCFDHCPALQLGQQWQFKATLKSAKSLSDQARHRYWIGSVQRGSGVPLTPVPARGFNLLQLRYQLAQRIQAGDPDPNTHSLLQALTLGLSESIHQDLWGLLRRTGTTHLMVISGAHIGLVAGLMYKITQWLWCRSSICVTLIPAPRVASVVGIVSAIAYATLAGLGIPALRACVAFSVLMLRYLSYQRFTAWQAWRIALAVVVSIEPHACLMPGFYLSFIAAGILIAANQRLELTGFKQLLVVQLLCLIGLLPLTLYVFSYASLNGFFANLLAIPFVSMLITPLGLLALILNCCINIDGLLYLLHASLSILLQYLHWIDSLSAINITWRFTHISQVLGILLALNVFFWLPLPRLIPASVVLLLAAFSFRPAAIAHGNAEIAVLDVGQGLSVVVHTKTHVLVYDTGMQFLNGGDMAQKALIPYLQNQQVRQLDAVVISHPDLDHRGGLDSLIKQYPIQRLLVDNPAVYQHAFPCHAESDWEWDGVSFHFFALPELNSKNNRSCVLRIQTTAGSMLLTGDIERAAEDYLVKEYGQALKSTVLLIPHHGSKTSSSVDFVAAVAPHYAIASYGLGNRYHFPHPQAMAVYQQQHIPVLATANQGCIRVNLLNHIDFPANHMIGLNNGF